MVRQIHKRIGYAEARLALSAPLVRGELSGLWEWWTRATPGPDRRYRLQEKMSSILPPAWTGWFLLPNDTYDRMFEGGMVVEPELDVWLASHSALQHRYTLRQCETHSVGFLHVHMQDVLALSSPVTIRVDARPAVMYERKQGFHA